MAEWLRRWTRNPMGSARAGSNPAQCVFFFPFLPLMNFYFQPGFFSLSFFFPFSMFSFFALHPSFILLLFLTLCYCTSLLFSPLFIHFTYLTFVLLHFHYTHYSPLNSRPYFTFSFALFNMTFMTPFHFYFINFNLQLYQHLSPTFTK